MPPARLPLEMIRPLMPWVYSCAMTALSKSLSRSGPMRAIETWTGAGHVPYATFRDQILTQTRNFLWWEMDLANAAD